MPPTAEGVTTTAGRAGRRLPTLIRHLRVLRAVGEAVNSTLDLEQVIERSLEALTRVTRHEISSLHLLSSDGARLLLRGDRGLSERLRAINRVLPMGAGLIGGVAASGLPRRVQDVARVKDLLPADADPHAPYTVYKADVSYFSGKLEDYEYPAAEVQKALEELPQVNLAA